MSQKPTFHDRRMHMAAAADDAEGIARDLAKFAAILAENARFLAREAEEMQRAEARFAERAERKKAAPEGRPLSSN